MQLYQCNDAAKGDHPMAVRADNIKSISQKRKYISLIKKKIILSSPFFCYPLTGRYALEKFDLQILLLINHMKLNKIQQLEPHELQP